jgi:uncharacterized membrane protein YfcA
MNSQFLKDHLIDFEVFAALGIGALMGYGLGTGWLLAILCGLSVFVLIPLLILFAAHIRALLLYRRNRP